MFRRGGESAAFLIHNTRKIHTTFPDGSELVEEYDAETHRLKCRRRRRPTTTGAAGPWEVLVGDLQPVRQESAPSAAPGGLMMQESSSNPRCVRVDNPGFYTWHVTNLTYPKDTYNVALDPEAAAVVVSTSNKKYFKHLEMPEMLVLQLVAEPSRLSWDHAAATLTVNYSKPPALLAEELADAKAAASMRVQESPAECKQQ